MANLYKFQIIFCVLSLCAPLLAAGWSEGSGRLTAIGNDYGAEALENPALLWKMKGRQSAYLQMGTALDSLASSEWDDNVDGAYAGGMDISALNLNAAYTPPRLLDDFEFGIALRNHTLEDDLDLTTSRYNFTTNRMSNRRVGHSRAVFGLTTSPAAAYTISEEFKLGLALPVYYGGAVYSTTIKSKSDSSYEEFENLSLTNVMFRPTLGVHSTVEGGAEFGIRLIPFVWQMESVSAEKQLFELTDSTTQEIDRSVNLSNATFRLGRAALGVRDELVDDFIFSAEARLGLAYKVAWERMRTSTQNGDTVYQRTSQDLNNDGLRGFSGGVMTTLVDDSLISIGFSFDAVSGTEVLKKEGDNLSDAEDFFEASFEEQYYALTLGYVYTGLERMQIIGNLTLYQSVLKKSSVLQPGDETASSSKDSQVTRSDGFKIDVGYQMMF